MRTRHYSIILVSIVLNVILAVVLVFSCFVLDVPRKVFYRLFQERADKYDYRENPVYYWRMNLFRAYPSQSIKVVMLGDSLTELCDWNELLAAREVANRGISTDTTIGVLNRMDEVIALKPRICFLMIGINDIQAGKDVDEIAGNIRVVSARLLSNGVQVVVQSCLPVTGRFQASAAINEKVWALNALLRRICQEEGYDYLDVASVLSGEGILLDNVALDGLHLKGEGYRQWGRMLKEYLDHSRKRLVEGLNTQAGTD